MEIKKYPFVTCSREPGSDIVFAVFAENLMINLSIARELVANRLDFTENKSHYLVLDFSNIKGFTAEAKAYMQNPEVALVNILGSAFFASNPVSALLANIFVKTPKKYPSKYFPDKKGAFAWINELKQKTNKTK